MKIGNFNLMSYRHLPEDFKQRHESVWVDIPSGLFDPVLLNRDFNAALDEHEFAAAVGFDMVGVNEDHNNGYGLMLSRT